MRGSSPTCSASSSTSLKLQNGRHQSQSAEHHSQDEGVGPKTQRDKEKANDALLLEGARICAVLAQATAVVERIQRRASGDDLSAPGSNSGSESEGKGRENGSNDNAQQDDEAPMTKPPPSMSYTSLFASAVLQI